MKSYFTNKGIPYTCRDISQDKVARREWRERFAGEIVPTVVFNGGKRVVDGCDIPAIERALRELAVASPRLPKPN